MVRIRTQLGVLKILSEDDRKLLNLLESFFFLRPLKPFSENFQQEENFSLFTLIAYLWSGENEFKLFLLFVDS